MAHSALFGLHFLLIPLFLLATIAPSIHQSIPLGTTISAVDENSSWVSPSGEFAFGFRHLPNNDSLLLLAIWFQKIPERTVVWSANRDRPVQRESRVELVNNGYLVLYDHEGREIWKKPNAINARATSASMLNTGNLVLWSTDSSTIWESFNEPTDTILPSQTLTKPSKLSSRRSEKDYSKGQFELRLQEDGDLMLYTVPLEGEFTYSNYWSTNTAGSGSQVIFKESGYIYLAQINGTSVSLTPGNIVSTQEFYHRATLDFDGVIRQYVYPRTLDSTVGWAQSWSNVWYQPPNVCLAVFFDIGSGACGFNSYCALDENQRTTCHCPPGYSYLDPNNTFGGCKQDFVPQSCESGGSIEASQFELKEMRNVDWPLNDYERYFPINENLCRQECLMDCFCAVAVFKDDTCWKKMVPLGNGKMDYGVSRKTLVKTPRGNLTLQTAPPPTSSCREKKDRTALILIGSVLFGGSGLLNLLLLLAISMVLLYSHHQRKVRFQHAKDDLKRVERMVMVAIWCIQENPTMRPSMMKVTEMLEGVVEGGWTLLVGDDKEALQDRKVLERMVMVVIWCVQEDPSLRPSMKRVVRMMAGVVEVSAPMDPCF
ncbi:G-type lectin S-receptor-like serine/threonine-protein kinase LECRK3 [Cinnamomum micranthum f. kanehirae]|uniref:G-type lectin S-receptor-like serine/threonine-protein kinase LECRK3 n=1 Tax=Cinnamomum micranthum f. kanehirae TaxID=337451 RepID=A0A3S3PZ21_9MAGN|nr:G-type lectin S-receptor-like serine/threonine-protein kinase LECRK3 [Cinnamomum micranthum f. kanehirae]